jgi:hypothetical protein
MKEINEFEILRKGNRVRLYLDNSNLKFKDGTVVLGAYVDKIIYVLFDDEQREEHIEGYKLLKLTK